MTTLTLFHRFPLLPSELRIRIYGFALSTPRNVVVSCHKEKIQGTRQFTNTFTSKSPVPALLHMSRESRVEGLKVYKPALRTEASLNYTYICFEQDTIECTDQTVQHLEPLGLERVQQMLVHVHDSALFWHFHMNTIMGLKSLKLLNLFASQELINWSTDRRWVDGMINDIGLTKEKFPDWVCPHIKVIDKDSKEELATIPGGVWIGPEEETQSPGQ